MPWTRWEGVMISSQKQNNGDMVGHRFEVELPIPFRDCVTILEVQDNGGRMRNMMSYLSREDGNTDKWDIKTISNTARNEYELSMTLSDDDKIMGTYCSTSPFDIGHFEMRMYNKHDEERKKLLGGDDDNNKRNGKCMIM